MKKLFLLSFILLCASFAYAQENATNVTVPEVPEIICSVDHCDRDCVKCADRVCHDPGFVCTEKIALDRFFPNEIDLGMTQLNIVLRNTGTVNLDDIYAVVTGDGIETLDKISLQKLVAGDKDYVFAKINASKPGTIDIIIKVYVNGKVMDNFVDQVIVKEPVKVEVPIEVFNATLLTNSLDALRQQYKTLESEYQVKKSQSYTVDFIYDKLNQAYNQILDVQASLVAQDYKAVQLKIAVVQSNLADIKEQLDAAQKPVQTFTDKVRTNLLLYGSIAAAIISIFTAYKLVQNSIDKKKLLELHKRLTSRKKKKRK